MLNIELVNGQSVKGASRRTDSLLKESLTIMLKLAEPEDAKRAWLEVNGPTQEMREESAAERIQSIQRGRLARTRVGAMIDERHARRERCVVDRRLGTVSYRKEPSDERVGVALSSGSGGLTARM